MDGVTLVRELRALPNYDPVALIVLSTEAGPELKQKGREASATGWMAKPFDPAAHAGHRRQVHLTAGLPCSSPPMHSATRAPSFR